MRDSLSLRVLLIEDLPTQRQLGQWVLESAGGLEVLTAGDGLTGLDLAWSARPDVILLDLILPGISGLELLRRYRRQRGPTPVLVLTGAGDSRVSDAAIACGATYVLRKPVDWTEVIHLTRFFAGGLTLLCERELRGMGAPAGWAGVYQAARCAALLGEGRCSQLKEAYIQTGAECHTGWDCVAKNIERLIRRLHTDSSPAYQAFVRSIGHTGRPTNGDFLRALARSAIIPL